MNKYLIPIFSFIFFCFLASSSSFAQCRMVHFLSEANNNSKTFTVQQGPMGLCNTVTVTNTTATAGLDLRFYDVYGPPNCASSTGVKWNLAIPVNATTAAAVGGFTIPISQVMTFTNGIGVCLTGAVADNDNTNAVTGVQVNFGVMGN